MKKHSSRATFFFNVEDQISAAQILKIRGILNYFLQTFSEGEIYSILLHLEEGHLLGFYTNYKVKNFDVANLDLVRQEYNSTFTSLHSALDKMWDAYKFRTRFYHTSNYFSPTRKVLKESGFEFANGTLKYSNLERLSISLDQFILQSAKDPLNSTILRFGYEKSLDISHIEKVILLLKSKKLDLVRLNVCFGTELSYFAEKEPQRPNIGTISIGTLLLLLLF
jgi:hypothetical protein